MSENLVAVLVASLILLALAAWPPLLGLVCPPCSRLLRRRRTRPAAAGPAAAQPQADAA